MNYHLDKQKLPSGFSFPLARNVLDQGLEEACIQQIHHVYYRRYNREDIVLRADYLSEDHRGWFAAGQSSITIYAVHHDQRADCTVLLIQEALPKLYLWLQQAKNAKNTWRAVNHSISFVYKKRSIYIIDN